MTRFWWRIQLSKSRLSAPFSFSSRMQPWLKSRLVRKKLEGRRVVQVYVVGNVLRGFASHSSGHSV